jgi:ammonium transporter, Amt family
MHFTPGLRLRCSEEAEILGIDDTEMGEFAYDYVGVEAEVGHRTGGPVNFSDNVPADGTGAAGGREPRHSMERTRSYVRPVDERMTEKGSPSPK